MSISDTRAGECPDKWSLECVVNDFGMCDGDLDCVSDSKCCENQCGFKQCERIGKYLFKQCEIIGNYIYILSIVNIQVTAFLSSLNAKITTLLSPNWWI